MKIILKRHLALIVILVSLFVGCFVLSDFTSKTAKADPEVNVLSESDVWDVDFIDCSGEQVLCDLGASQYTGLNFDLTLPSNADFEIKMTLFCNGGVWEQAPMLKFTNGNVTATRGDISGWYQGPVNYSNAVLNAGQKVNIEVGVLGAHPDGPHYYYLKVAGNTIIDGTNWCEVAPTGTKIAYYTNSTFTIGNKPVVDEKAIEDFIDVDGFVCSGPVFVELNRENYVSLKFRIFIIPNDDFRIRIIVGSDGETMVDNGTGTVSGLGEYIITNGRIIYTYPNASHFYESQAVSVDSIVAGATILIEVGVKGQDDNGTYEYFIKVNGTTCIDKFDMAYGQFRVGEGTVCAIYSDTPIYIEESTATCNHIAVDCDEFDDNCMHATLKCSECDKVLSGVIEHNFGDLIEAVPATCEENGTVSHYHCTRCGKYFDEGYNEIDTIVESAKGHTIVWQNEVPSDCLNHGTPGHYICSVCGKFFNENREEIDDPTGTLPLTGHNMTHHNLIPADCESTGTKEHYHCSLCNKNFEDENGTIEIADIIIPKAEHSFGEWIPEVPATTEEEGTKGHYHCSVCGQDFDEDYEEIDSLVIQKLPVEEKGGCGSSIEEGNQVIIIMAILTATIMLVFAKKRSKR